MRLPYENVVNYAITRFADKENPTLLDFNHLKNISQVQQGLVTY